MIAREPTRGRIAHGNRGNWAFVATLVALGLVGIWIVGCQQPATPERASAVQQQPEKAGLSTGQGQVVGQSSPTADEIVVRVPNSVASRVSGGQPRIAVVNPVCDLGEIGVGTKLKGAFKFTNAGDGPLRIIMVRGCCGVTLRGVEAGQEYAPGQSGVLEFDYQALSIPNPSVVRSIYIQTNDPRQEMTSLTIKAKVVRRVDYTPESLRLVLNRPNAGCPDITLTSLDGQPFSITGFRATAGTITAQFDPAVKATKFVLKPQVDVARVEENMRGQISIDLTHPECQNVRLLYDVLPEFSVSVPSIMMFGLKPGQGIQREIWVLSNYQDDFEIESVSSLKGTIKLLEKTKVDNRYQLRIEVTPPPREGSGIVASDTLQVEIKGGKTLTIPFRGFYQDQ